MAVGFDGNVNNAQQLQQIKLRKLQAKGVQVQSTKNIDMTRNGSIFNMVSNNQTKAQGARPTMRPPASPLAAAAESTKGVVTVNTKAAIDDVSGVKPKTSAGEAESVKAGTRAEENQRPDLSNIDFDNLSGLSEPDLTSLKQDIQTMLDENCPFFLRAPMESKLKKVNAELKTRHEQEGDKVSEDNKKADDKSNEAMTRSAEDGTKEAASGGAAAEKGTAETNKMSQETTNLQKSIEAQQKSMQNAQAKGQKEVDKNTKGIIKEQKSTEQLTAENEQLNLEIEAMNEAAEAEGSNEAEGSDESASAASTRSAEIQAKSTRITVNSTKIAKSSIAIKKYTTASNKTIRALTKSNRAYVKSIGVAQKQLVQNEQKAGGFMETMEKINDISSKVATVGTVTKYTGMAMQLCVYTMAAGKVMEVAGGVAETVGNYGVCAANIGKTAVYAAQGNIMGALTSAGTAIMSGATAVQGTKQLAAAADIAKNGAQNAATEAGKEVAKDLVQDTAKDAAKDATKKLFKDEAGKVIDKGVKGFANAYSVQLGNQSTTQILMGLGSSLQGAAAMFQNNETSVTTTATPRAYRQNAGLKRRKIA